MVGGVGWGEVLGEGMRIGAGGGGRVWIMGVDGGMWISGIGKRGWNRI
jgi:hypothetical protein